MFGMIAHLIDTHLLVPRSRSFAKVKVKYQGHVSQKMRVSEALVFHKHILFLIVFFFFLILLFLVIDDLYCFLHINFSDMYIFYFDEM